MFDEEPILDTLGIINFLLGAAAATILLGLLWLAYSWEYPDCPRGEVTDEQGECHP